MLKEEPPARPWGGIPAPPPCACQVDPAFCLRPALDGGAGTQGSDSRDSVWGDSVF